MNNLKVSQNTVRQASQNSSLFRCAMESGYGCANSLQIHYVEEARLPEFLHTRKNCIAGLVSYGESGQFKNRLTSQIPSPLVKMKQFHEEPVLEVWTGVSPFTYIQEHGCCLALNGHFLFGVVQITESEDEPLEDLTNLAYKSMLKYMGELGYPHPLRIWNYFSGINHEHNEKEQYKQFCIGRHRAFANTGENFYTLLPAATAIGTQVGPLQIHFLAGKHPGMHIENPRQVSAYHYPPIYGPKSPSFARATLVPMGNEPKLFIAGTASIVGHATQHQGNFEDQTQETLCNIEALISHVMMNYQTDDHYSVKSHLVKVYMRHQE